MNRRQIILDVVSQYAKPQEGFWVFTDGQVRLVGGALCAGCQTLQMFLNSKIKSKLLPRIDSIVNINGFHDIILPLGISLRAFCLKPVVEVPAIVFSITSISKKKLTLVDRAIIESYPRKSKKLLSMILNEAPEFTRATRQEPDGVFNEIAVELRSRYEELKEAAFTNTLASYKDFVSSFCHEALSPIQEIQTTMELALQDKTIVGQTHKRLDSSHRSLEGLRVSLEGMRLLFRDDHQQPLPNQFRNMDLSTIVIRWFESYQAQFEEKNILAILEPSSRAWNLRCVPEYIEILVRNLISNGVKYSFDASSYTGGEPGKFLVRFDQSQRRLVFVNFGVPISQHEIESGALFERDARGGSANDRGRVGKGVGLYLVKRVADLHDATITVRSQVQNPGGFQEFARNEFEIRFPP